MQPHKPPQYYTVEELAALARSLAEGFTQQEVAHLVSEERARQSRSGVTQPSVAEALTGAPSMVRLLIDWIELRYHTDDRSSDGVPDVRFQRGEDEFPKPHYRFVYEYDAAD